MVFIIVSALIVCFIVLLLVLPLNLGFEAVISKAGIYSLIKPVLFDKPLPIGFPIRMEYRRPYGPIVFIGRSPFKEVSFPRKRSGGFPSPFKFSEIKYVSVFGVIGIFERPDHSVILAGAADALISAALIPFSRTEPMISVLPSFEKNAFVLKASCIVSVYPGRLLIETIKLGRRKKNESSDRKHYAFINGARKEARRR